MKKFYSFLFAAVALVGFAACNSDSAEEVAPKQEVGKMEFTANVDDTRTSLNGQSVKWCTEDEISINGKVYTIKEGSISDDGKTATFVGAAVEAPYKAYYPANVAVLNANVAVDTFAEGANVAVSYSETTDLAFKNVLSVLKFQVTEACETVTLESTSALVGAFTVDNDYKVSSTGATTVTLEGVFETGKTYYTTIFPGDHALTIRTNGYLSTTKDSRTAVRNMIYDLKTLPAPVQDNTWLVRGDHNNWGNTDKMYVDVNYLNKDGYKLLVLRNQPIKKTGFKFASSDWGLQVGAHDDNNSSDADVVVTPMTWWYGSNVNYNNKKAHICVDTEEYNYDVYLLVDEKNTEYTQAWFHLCKTGTPMSSLPQSLD